MMTPTESKSRPGPTHKVARGPSTNTQTTQTLMALGLIAAVVVAGSMLNFAWPIKRAALFVHLASLIIGFGAVIVADVHGILWFLGRRTRTQMSNVIEALHPLIWAGLVGLIVSGLLLHPSIALPRTLIKMSLVAIATANGIWASSLSNQLNATSGELPEAVNNQLIIKSLVSGAISQTAWWGATIIGFMATTSH